MSLPCPSHRKGGSHLDPSKRVYPPPHPFSPFAFPSPTGFLWRTGMLGSRTDKLNQEKNGIEPKKIPNIQFYSLEMKHQHLLLPSHLLFFFFFLSATSNIFHLISPPSCIFSLRFFNPSLENLGWPHLPKNVVVTLGKAPCLELYICLGCTQIGSDSEFQPSQTFLSRIHLPNIPYISCFSKQRWISPGSVW